MSDVKCVDCGKLGVIELEDGRAQGRCPICASHFTMRTKYTNEIQKARSQYQSTRARKEVKKAKHCPSCHHLRHRDQYLKFSDMFGHCSMCRDLAEDRALGAQRKARNDARLDATCAKLAREGRERMERELGTGPGMRGGK